MPSEGGTRNTKSLVWGLFLIALGGAFLLERFGVIELPNIGRLWPLVFVVIGITHLFELRPGSAVTFIFMGAWFMACNEGWFGLSYANSWPLLMVVVGVGIVVGGIDARIGMGHVWLRGERGRRRREGGES